jgi:hypothetical protein
LGLGLVLGLTGGPARAEKPLTEYPVEVQNAFKRAERLQADKQPREALAAYEEAGRLGMDGHPLLSLKVAACRQELGQYTEAVATFTQAIDEASLGQLRCRR